MTERKKEKKKGHRSKKSYFVSPSQNLPPVNTDGDHDGVMSFQKVENLASVSGRLP